MRKFGFTLAEVLITLGIIGVVSALTIPTLLQKNYERQTVAKLKETYSLLHQIFKLVEEEHGGFGEVWNDSAGALEIAEKLKPFLKISIDCGLEDLEGKCIYNEDYKRNTGKDYFNYATSPLYYKLVLLNGVSIFWRGASTSNTQINGEYPITVFVDTNGHLPPNVLSYDLFEFFYYPNTGLLPVGKDTYQEKCLNVAKGGALGYPCTYYVVNFGRMDYMKK